MLMSHRQTEAGGRLAFKVELDEDCRFVADDAAIMACLNDDNMVLRTERWDEESC
jgi:hypothetical protein